MDNMKIKNSKSKNSIGFFVALGICILAVGIASFTTYNSVKKFKNSGTPSVSSANPDSIEQTALSEQDSATPDESFCMYSANDRNNDTHASSVDTRYNLDESVETRGESSGLIVYPSGKDIIKNYSNDTPVYSKTMDDWRVHNGIDFKCEQGSKVQAVTNGVVKEIYDDSLYGLTIVIDHSNDFTAYYSGLGNTTMVKVGDNIETGQEIGSINDIPCERQDGYHLHFAVKKDGGYINPTDVLGPIS